MLEDNAPKKKTDVAPVIDWIPCSERLPDKSDFYMVCAYNGDTYDYRKNWFYHEDDYGDSEWTGLIPCEKVIAWVPLPEPYRENEKMLENEEQREDKFGLKRQLEIIFDGLSKDIDYKHPPCGRKTIPDGYPSISEKFMNGEISEDEFVEQYNRLVEQEAEKHWEPVEPHEHI